MPAPARRHLLAVWNPVVGADAMEQHLRVLQDAARKYRHNKARADEVYVWWGKLRSAHRMQPLPHMDEILGVETEAGRDDEGPETDYASLYGRTNSRSCQRALWDRVVSLCPKMRIEVRRDERSISWHPKSGICC